MIKSLIAGNATVTESAELTDLVRGDKREVDVCIETNVAGHPLIIGIECRDHTCKQTVTWIDEMHAKHSRLPTDHLVLGGPMSSRSSSWRIRERTLTFVTPRVRDREGRRHVIPRVAL